MASYIVLEPEGMATKKAEQAILIRDGFAFLAFIAPPIWFAWHRMWLETLAFLAAILALAALGMISGYGTLSLLLSLLLSLFIGFEAQGLRVAVLRRRGWSVWGVVESKDRGEAELRYASEVEVPERHSAAAQPSVPTVPQPRKSGAKTANMPFGLLDYPRRS